ncbi:MBL fold metallo-hydrolase [archaeon]|nr:MAG: MBL fold metallo-hydrolase [archaeon]
MGVGSPRHGAGRKIRFKQSHSIMRNSCSFIFVIVMLALVTKASALVAPLSGSSVRNVRTLPFRIFRVHHGTRRLYKSNMDSQGLHTKEIRAMTLTELRLKYKQLGGKPEGMKKFELIEACESLQENTWTKRPPFRSKLNRESNGTKTADINGIPLPDIFNQLNMLSRATSSASARYALNNLGHLPMTDDDRKLRFPVGIFRDNRLPVLETGEMELYFLGTASCVPSVSRGVSSLTLRYKGDVWMFDCGEGTQVQIQSSKLRPNRINKIFISHLHGDHLFGLPGLLCLLGKSKLALKESQEYDCAELPPIDIYGPEGIRDYIRASMQLSYSRITVPYRVHELKDVPLLNIKTSRLMPPSFQSSARMDPQFGERRGRDIYPNSKGVYDVVTEEDGVEMTVQAAPLTHSIPCVGYVITEKVRKGMLNVDSIKEIVERNKDALNAMPEFYTQYRKVFGVLKSLPEDGMFTFPDGTVLKAEDVTNPPRKGRKVVILGDTCSSNLIADIAMDADVLVHEATNAYIEEYDKTRYASYDQLQRDTLSRGHSTPQMAGSFAKRINAKKLILTHFSPRYQGDSSEASMRMMWRLEDQARKMTDLKEDDDVIAAWDFMHITIN